jgi:hypothetical protein
VCGAGALRRSPARILCGALAAAGAMYVAAYCLTSWEGTATLVHPTWNRFMLQCSVPLLVLLGLAAGQALAARAPA